jgi:hypothetical protein
MKKLQINFPESTVEKLTAKSKSTGACVAEIVRRAVQASFEQACAKCRRVQLDAKLVAEDARK